MCKIYTACIYISAYTSTKSKQTLNEAKRKDINLSTYMQQQDLMWSESLRMLCINRHHANKDFKTVSTTTVLNSVFHTNRTLSFYIVRFPLHIFEYSFYQTNLRSCLIGHNFGQYGILSHYLTYRRIAQACYGMQNDHNC